MRTRPGPEPGPDWWSPVGAITPTSATKCGEEAENLMYPGVSSL